MLPPVTATMAAAADSSPARDRARRGRECADPVHVRCSSNYHVAAPSAVSPIEGNPLGYPGSALPP